MSFLVDSHCHLDFPGLAERLPEVLANMDALGVGWALCIGVTLEDFPKVLTVARSDDRLWASVGVHPDHEGGEEPTLERLVELAADSKVIGIGETGLDYYRLTDRPEWQRERFRTHLRAARACGKPVIVHTRAAAGAKACYFPRSEARLRALARHASLRAWIALEARVRARAQWVRHPLNLRLYLEEVLTAYAETLGAKR